VRWRTALHRCSSGPHTRCWLTPGALLRPAVRGRARERWQRPCCPSRPRQQTD
jgi:hypothetical protein